MGTRSMATHVATKDIGLIIDPSVALAPERFNLPPHPKEIERMKEQWEDIKAYARKSGLLIVTHYHYDHHNPDEPSMYKGKTVLLKNPKENINKSQTGRAKKFLEGIEGIAKEIIYSDGKEFSFGDTMITFSEPMTHGFFDRLGYVTEVLIEDKNEGKRFIHTSDVLGPCTDAQTEFIIDEKPDIAFIDGPMNFTMVPAIENLKKIILVCDIKEMVVDHHLLRDARWREKISDVYLEAEKKGTTRVLCAAEYKGVPVDQLETKRKALWKESRILR